MKATLILFSTVIFIGCSSVDVTTDYDRDADFGRYTTFDWVEGHNPRDGGPSGLSNPLAVKNIRSAIARELGAKGVTEDKNAPDILVAVHAGVRDKVDVERYGYRYGRFGRRVGTYTTVERYKEGTIVVDVIDAKTRDLVWRGIAKDALTRGESRSEYIDECIRQLFKEYPPKK